ncbi:hypothetical protein [Providencia rettgeri]|uniref:hypothetical protein n=1 Tax=Providencia rettgeri TaxID=587 RepID=UPI000D7D8B22|nr:hypothetical protein [Providencia rettgeri]AWS52290.1 hypothetical protein AM461_16410 [Providencia rettgeri]MBS0917720.1 hypothetical protein [Providencia rettgeri]
MGNLTDLAILVCGSDEIDDSNNSCEFSEILKHLKTVIQNLLTEIEVLSSDTDSRIMLYGPFLARTLLEVGVTAIIGRLDPTRLLVIKRTQQHGDYCTDKPWSSAIRWQGDVVDSKGQGPKLWPVDKNYKEISKALLGDYYFDLYWEKALEKISDSESSTESTAGNWLAQIKAETISQFSATRRKSASRLYSESSKGIHSEFVIPPGTIYDIPSIKKQVLDVIQLLSDLGLLVNHIPHIAYRIEATEAINLFNGIEQIEVML